MGIMTTLSKWIKCLSIKFGELTIRSLRRWQTHKIGGEWGLTYFGYSLHVRMSTLPLSLSLPLPFPSTQTVMMSTNSFQ